MVAQNANIDALLAKLSKAKPLPRATETFTTPVQQARTQVRDAVTEYSRRAPTLQESLNKIAQGQQSSTNPALGVAAKVFGNPIVKTALMPLVAFDTGRRSVISGVREITDLLDSDPNTKASFADFGKQAMDTSYGFGTAFPMGDGWGGRIAGFVGDVLLDPLTYATLGTAVPAAAAIRGTGVATRTALGAAKRSGVKASLFGANKPVRIITADARNNLATVVGNQARQINLLDDATAKALNLKKRSEKDINVIEQLVAKYGKTRVPPDIARDIGLPKAGVYWFGSRVKMPLSGTLGKALEFGLAGTRTRITGQTTGAIGRMLNQITPEGVKSDAVNVRDMRRALITGKATPEEASFYLKALDDNRQRRVIENFTKEEYQRKFNLEIANNPLVVKYKDDIGELLENPQRLASASAEELQAHGIVKTWFESLGQAVNAQMKLVDPDFNLNLLPNYFPHQQTEAALKYMDNLRNPFVEQLRVYLKTDVADPSVAFSHRTLQKGKVFFGVTLTDKDVAGGVKTLNQIARDNGFKGDFFETDALKALSKYGDSYASEISRADFLRRSFSNGTLAYLEAKGIYDLEAMKSLESAVRTALKDVSSNSRTVADTAGKLTGVLRDALDVYVRGAKRSVGAAKTLSRSRTTALVGAEKNLGNIKTAVDTLVEALEKSGLKEASQRLEQFGISGILADTVVDVPLQRLVTQLDGLSGAIKKLNTEIANGTKTLDDYKSELGSLNKLAESLEKEATKFTQKINEFDEIHEILGDFVNGKYADNLIESAEEGGSEGLQQVVKLIKNQTLRDRVGLTKTGKIKPANVAVLWGETNATPEVLILKQWLDPAGNISQTQIKNLTIDGVRDIIARSAVASSGLGDLRKALVWMIVRDIDRSPTLLSSAVEQLKTGAKVKTVSGNNLSSLVDDSGTIARISQIKETIDRITKLKSVLDNAATETPGASIVSGDTVQVLRNQASQIDDEILEQKLLMARADASAYGSELFGLRSWTELAQNQPNKIVANAEEIEDLFLNLRAGADAANNLNTTPKGITNVGKAVEQIGVDEDIAEITINALKAGGIENQQLTYSHVQDFLELYVERLNLPPQTLPKMTAALNDIADLERTRATLATKINESAGRVRADVRDEFAAALDSRTYTEMIMDYSNEALEYYVYSETKSQFNNLMDELAPFGVKPSYGLYQRLLGDIAHNHIVKTEIIQQQVEDAERILRQIQTDVANTSATARPPTSPNPITGERSTSVFVAPTSKGSALRAALKQALSNPEDAAILDAVFPEIRAALSTKGLGFTDMSRLQARDEELIRLRGRLSGMLREIADKDAGQAGVKQRAGYAGKPLTDFQASKLPTKSFNAPAPYVKQVSTDLLVNQIEGNPNNVKDIFKLIANIREVMGNRVSPKTMIEIEQVLGEVSEAAKLRVDAIKTQALEAKEANKKAGLPSGRRSSAKEISSRKQLSKLNYNYGLSGSLVQALNSTGNKKVNLFFGNLFGGTVIDQSNQFTKYTGVAKTLRQETNQNAIYKVISYDGSTFGIVNRKLSERSAGLRATSDFDYDIAGVMDTGSVLPGLTQDARAATSAYGIKAYAEVLNERAKEIEATILNNEEFANTVRRLRKKVDAESSVAVENQIMELIRQEEVVISGNNIFRVSPQTNISSLPKAVQGSIIQGRKLKIAIKKIMETDEYISANQEQTLNYVLHELANLDAYRLVNSKGVPGLFIEESGLTPGRTWNAPRPGRNQASNLDDLAVQTYISNQPEFLFAGPATFANSYTELGVVAPGTPPSTSGGLLGAGTSASPNILGQRSALKNGTPNYDVHTMEEVPFSLNSNNFDNSDYVYLIPEGNGLRRVLSENELIDLDISQIKVLKYKSIVGKGFGKNVRDDSRILSSTRYEPSTTWVKLRSESEAVGATKTGSEGAVTRGSRPEVWVPSSNIINHEASDSVKLLNTNFSADEWESLFVPGPIQEKGKIQSLSAQLAKANQSRMRFAEMSRASSLTKTERQSLLTKYDKADKAYQSVQKELALYKARAGGRAKLNRLVSAFEDPEVARLLNVAGKRGKAVTPQQVAQAFVRRHLKGVGDNGVPVVPADAKQIIKRQTGIKNHWKTTGDSKVLGEVKQLQKEMNDLAFVQYSKSLEQQYANYLETLEELRIITNDWTKSQSTVENAKMLKAVLANPKVKAVVDTKVPKAKMTLATEKQIKKLITSGNAANEEEALALIAAHNDALGASAESVRGAQQALESAPPQAPLVVADDAAEIRAGLADSQREAAALTVTTKELIENLKFKEVLKTENIAMIKQIIDNMTIAERTLLTSKVKQMEQIASIDSARLKLINNALRKAKVKAKSKDPVERLVQLSEANDLAVASFDQAKHLKTVSDTSLADSKQMLERLEDVLGRGKGFTKPNSKDLDWAPEFEAWRDEAVELINLLSKNNSVSPRTKTILTAWVDGVNALELSKVNLPYAQDALEAERGMKELFDRTGVGYNKIVKDLKDGYEFLNKDAMPNVMVKQAYAEILRNANSFRDPLAGVTLNRVLKNWNSYWKPLATTTPGFHVRNNVGNVMALVFGGARMRNLPEATEISFKWLTSAKDNISWDEFVKTLTPEQQGYANGARWAVAATGGGVYSDVQLADNIVQRNKVIAASRNFGFTSDSFARFVFSYDAMMQGFSPEQAAMRTKRFYIDYEDISSFDKTMRQIVPFWMWTSRNVVTQVQNMWLNPKPYQIYNSFTRNFRDKDDDNAVTKSWRDLQAFKLPFGNDLYAMPDLGFTRVQQQMETAKRPTQFLADVNPLLRVPVELISGKQFYNEREFKDKPVQVEGFGLGSALQPLAQLLGMGETNAQGQRFVDEKFLYGATSLAPPISIADRLMPSTGASAGEFNMNTLAGLLGSPVKQLTPQMQKNELIRRLFEIQKVAERTEAVNNPQG